MLHRLAPMNGRHVHKGKIMTMKSLFAMGLAAALLLWTACAPSGKPQTSGAGHDGSGQAALPAGAVYHVDNLNPQAADTNPGTAARPWKTLARAGSAKELK